MVTTKPYVRKPLFHSERGEMVLTNVTGYVIRVGPNESRTTSPGQCLAALMAAKAAGLPCIVYALGEAYGMETMEVVDAEFLLTKAGIA